MPEPSSAAGPGRMAGGPVVAVVGGGISGLAAAWRVRQLLPSAQVLVIEAGTQAGGKLRRVEVGGIGLDGGAEAILARRPEAVDLARAVGLGEALVEPETVTARIWSRGRLHPMPAGTVMGVPSSLRPVAASGLLSRSECARVAADRVLPGRPPDDDVEVGRHVRRRMGSAAVDRLVEPLLGGVYAGRADGLSMAATIPALFAAARSRRSLLAAAQAAGGPSQPMPRDARASEPGPPARPHPLFVGIRGGVARLAMAVAKDCGASIRTGTPVRELRRTPSGWGLVLGPVPTPEVLHADAVILATPAHATARLLGGTDPLAASLLAGIEYASVALVTAVLPPDALAPLPPGSGFLVPPAEGTLVKGVTISSSKWAWTAAASGGGAVVRMSVGRFGDVVVLQRPDNELAQLALADLGRMVPVRRAPLATEVTRWGGALPQYALGHLDRVRRIRESLRREPTLALAGAAYDGVGIPACVASGQRAAEAVTAALASHSPAAAGEWSA